MARPTKPAPPRPSRPQPLVDLKPGQPWAVRINGRRWHQDDLSAADLAQCARTLGFANGWAVHPLNGPEHCAVLAAAFYAKGNSAVTFEDAWQEARGMPAALLAGAFEAATDDSIPEEWRDGIPLGVARATTG